MGVAALPAWLKPATLSWLTNCFVRTIQTERRYARNYAFSEGDATSTHSLYLCAQNYTVYQRLTCIKYTASIKLSSVHIEGWYSSGGEERNNLPSERRLNEMANLTRHCQFEYQNRGRINKIYLRELCFYVLLLTKHFPLCFPCT